MGLHSKLLYHWMHTSHNRVERERERESRIKPVSSTRQTDVHVCITTTRQHRDLLVAAYRLLCCSPAARRQASWRRQESADGPRVHRGVRVHVPERGAISELRSPTGRRMADGRVAWLGAARAHVSRGRCPSPARALTSRAPPARSADHRAARAVSRGRPPV